MFRGIIGKYSKVFAFCAENPFTFKNIARITNAVQVTPLSLSLSLKSLSKVPRKSLKSLSKASQKPLKSLSKVSSSVY